MIQWQVFHYQMVVDAGGGLDFILVKTISTGQTGSKIHFVRSKAGFSGRFPIQGNASSMLAAICAHSLYYHQ